MPQIAGSGADQSEGVTRESAECFVFPLGTDVSTLNSIKNPTDVTGVVELGDTDNDGVTRTRSRASDTLVNSFSTWIINGDLTCAVSMNLIVWDEVIQALVYGEYYEKATAGGDLAFTSRPNTSSKPFTFGLVMDYPTGEGKFQRDVYPEVAVSADVENQWSPGTDITVIPVTFTAVTKADVDPYTTYGFNKMGVRGTAARSIAGILGGIGKGTAPTT